MKSPGVIYVLWFLWWLGFLRTVEIGRRPTDGQADCARKWYNVSHENHLNSNLKP